MKVVFLKAFVLLFGLFTEVQGQRLETTIPLPDSIRGPGGPFSMAYNSREDKVYVGGMDRSIGVLIVDSKTGDKLSYINLGTSENCYVHPALVYNSLDNKVYFADGVATHELTIIDGNSDEVLAKLPGIEVASDLEWNSLDDKIYCSDRRTNQLHILDGVGDSLIDVLTVGAGPGDLLWNPANDRVYCANQGSNDLTVIDGSNDAILSTIQVGVLPVALALNQSDDKLYCSCLGSDEVIVLDTSEDTVIASIPMEDGPQSLLWIPDKIYCGKDGAGEISVIDGFGDTVIATITVDGIKIGTLAYDAANHRIFCTVLDSFWIYVNVAIIDATCDTMITSFTLGDGWGEPASANLLTIPSEDKVYATCLFSNLITVINGSSCHVETRIWTQFRLESFGWHQMVCVGDKLYCRSHESGGIAVLDLGMNSVHSFIPTGVFPQDLLWNSSDDKLYCTNWYSDDLTVIDCSSDSVLTTIPLRDPYRYTYPGPLVWNERGNKVYCAKTYRYSPPGELAVIDGVSDSVISTIAVGAFPYSLIWNSMENKIYCANWGGLIASNTVTVIDGVTDEVLRTITVGPGPACLVWSSLTNKLYCARDSYDHGAITVIGCTTDSVLTHIQMTDPPHHLSLAYNRTDNKVYYLNPWEGAVTVIDGWTDTILTTIEVGDWLEHAVWDSVNNWLFCSDAVNNEVAVVDGKGDTLISTIPLGEKPGFLAWSEPQKRVYVALRGDEGKLAVIRSSLNDIQSTEMVKTPTAFVLHQNYPNPFNPLTEILYFLPVACEVKLEVFNILGQTVCTLVDGRQTTGYKSVQWDGRDDRGQQIASGVYFYRIVAGEFIKIRKMALLR